MADKEKTLEQIVILGTVELIEKIANNKMNAVTLRDGSTFHRAESHVIKIIGEQPGIFSSEIARCFSVTRGAVQKILGRLEQKELIVKETDGTDRKRIRLFLTPSGQNTLTLLEEHQMEINKAFFNSMSSMPKDDLAVVDRFLTLTKQVLDDMQPEK